MNNRYSRSYFRSVPNRQLSIRGKGLSKSPGGSCSSFSSPYYKSPHGPSRPISPRSYIRQNQSSSDENPDRGGGGRHYNNHIYKSEPPDSLYRSKRPRASFDEEELEVKLPAPCKLSKIETKSSSLELESPASPPPASTLLSPESPPPPPPVSSSLPEDKEEGSPIRSKNPVPIIPQSPVIHQCRLCSACAPFRSEYDLLIHLTVIHYRGKLMKRVTRPPYKCLKCGYVPAVHDDVEDLLMHYGCEEKLSFQFYEQELRDLPPPENEDPLVKGGGESGSQTSSGHGSNGCSSIHSNGRISLNCELCNSCFDTERLFIRHISLRHFTKVLCDDLPKRRPFICPVPDCVKEKNNLHALMLHYGCEHNISMDLYLKAVGGSKDSIRVVVEEPPKSPRKSLDPLPPPPSSTAPLPTDQAEEGDKRNSSLQCLKCPKKKFASQMSLNYHLMVTHFFPDLPKVGPYFCHKCKDNYPERIDFTKHFLEVHLHEYLEDTNSPSGSSKKSSGEAASISNGSTPHRQSDVRRKITQKWETTSVEIQNHRIEELEKTISDLRSEHEDTLRRKSSDFEKWILQKEKQIEEEIAKRKTVQESLESSQQESLELKKQLENVQESHRSSEEKLAEKHNLNLSLIREKECVEKEVDALRDELKESNDLQANLEMSLKELKVQFDSRGDALEEKEDEMKTLREDQSKALGSLQRNLSKANKSLETLRSKLKQSNESKKTLNAQLKDNTKTSKKTETELRGEIENLRKSESRLRSDLESLKARMSEAGDASALRANVEELSEKLQGSEDRIQSLEVEKSSLTDRIGKVLKVLQDYETVLKEKNEKLAQNRVRIKELESPKESSLEPDNKELQRLKEEHAGTLKSLQSELSAVEKKYSKCSSSISVLAKDKSDLENRLTESQHSISSLESKVKGLQGSLKEKEALVLSLRGELRSKELLHAHCEASIRSGKEEIAALEERLSGQVCTKCSFLDPLESTGMSGGEGLQSQIQTLETSIHNKDMEIEHLKVNLNQLKMEMRKEKLALESQLKSVKALNEKLEEAKAAEKARPGPSRMKKKGVSRRSKESKKAEACLLEDNVNGKKGVQEPTDFIMESDFDPRLVKLEPSESLMSMVPLFNASKPSIVLNIGQLDDVLSADTSGGLMVPPPPPSPSALSHYYSDLEDLDMKEEEEDDAFDSFVFSSTLNKVTPRKNKLSLSGKRRSSTTNAAGAAAPLEDLTGKVDESEDDVVCEICLQYDPPLPEDAPRSETYNTEWVGCDCGAWYHKICTKLSKFSFRFSCKSVKKKCLKQ